MTSRMEGESVSSMIRRSMPTPSPAAGGMPYSRGAYVVIVVVHRFLIAQGLGTGLLPEAFGLILRVVQFRETVGQFAPPR